MQIKKTLILVINRKFRNNNNRLKLNIVALEIYQKNKVKKINKFIN
jgi:hypothetical protein